MPSERSTHAADRVRLGKARDPCASPSEQAVEHVGATPPIPDLGDDA